MQMIIRRAAAVRGGIGDSSSCMEIDFFLCKISFKAHTIIIYGQKKTKKNRKKYVANVKSLSSIEGVGAKIYYVGQNVFLERKPPQNFAILKFFAKNVMIIANGATDLRVGFCLPK